LSCLTSLFVLPASLFVLQAADHLSGFNVQNRYLIVLYYNPTRQNKKSNLKDQEEKLRAMQEKHGVDGEQHAKPQAAKQ
jgi:hypothetical protein